MEKSTNNIRKSCIMSDVELVCKAAKENSSYIAELKAEDRNKILRIISSALTENSSEILCANKADLDANADKPPHLLDRLALSEKRIAGIAEGLNDLCALPTPVGEVMEEWTVKSGLDIKKVRVPLGVIAIIYEARPNVTVDVIGLVVKSGNAVVLRGSKDAINSNKALVRVIKDALRANGYDPEFIQLVTDTTRESSEELMKCRKYVDVLIPRGSAGLIRTVVEKASVPVIETGTGNCHAYVEKTADLQMAKNIVLNGKLSRPSVCNALENLLVDRAIAKEFLPDMIAELKKNGVEVVGCEETVAICPDVIKATEEDYYTEFLGLKIAVKVVENYEEAIAHINKYSSSHSETIITRDENAAKRFTELVDSAAVYVNASTRFTDGYEFGFGAEMGISTQKIHARGPMGLKELTSIKYVVNGNGQVR